MLDQQECALGLLQNMSEYYGDGVHYVNKAIDLVADAECVSVSEWEVVEKKMIQILDTEHSAFSKHYNGLDI